MGFNSGFKGLNRIFPEYARYEHENFLKGNSIE